MNVGLSEELFCVNEVFIDLRVLYEFAIVEREVFFVVWVDVEECLVKVEVECDSFVCDVVLMSEVVLCVVVFEKEIVDIWVVEEKTFAETIALVEEKSVLIVWFIV